MKRPFVAAAFVFQLCLPACANQEVMSDTSETQQVFVQAVGAK